MNAQAMKTQAARVVAGLMALNSFALGAAADSSLFPNGEPDWSTLRTAGSHSVESTASSLEARYRTIGISESIGMRSDKFVGFIVIIR